jgi:hypothetical protein
LLPRHVAQAVTREQSDDGRESRQVLWGEQHVSGRRHELRPRGFTCREDRFAGLLSPGERVPLTSSHVHTPRPYRPRG